MSFSSRERNIPISRPQQVPVVQMEPPMPPPPMAGPPVAARNAPSPQPPPNTSVGRRTSIEDVSGKIVGMLDEIERRVENLRETASLMEMEKESLIEMLSTVQMNKDMLRLGSSDKEDLDATTNRLILRCKTVQVAVQTPRNPDQERALHTVNEQIDELVAKMKEDLNISKQVAKRYLNTCNPELPDGPIDQRFQSALIGCTADDQKKIRRKLEHLLQLFDRAEKTVVQACQ